MLDLVLFGAFPLPWWVYVAITLAEGQITNAGVTLYLHREQAHGAIKLHPGISHFFRFWLWAMTGMKTKVFVAVHRNHHATCETDDDPHSPVSKGIKEVLLNGVGLYRDAALRPSTMKYAYKNGKLTPGIPDDGIENHLYLPHNWLGIKLMFLVHILCFGPLIGTTIALVQMFWIPIWAAGVINGLGHWFGYRNGDTPDNSRNIMRIAFWIAGEELHNNHHTYPLSAKFSLRWDEFDIGWMYIRILEFFRLVKVNRCIPQEEHSRALADLSTLKLIRGDYGFVAAQCRKLLLFITKRELKDPQHAGIKDKLLVLQELLTDPKWNENVLSPAHERIRELNGSGSLLPRIGEFVQLFFDIKKTATSTEHTTDDREASLVSRLNSWVEDIEATQVPRAQAFARRLVWMVAFRPKRA